MRNAAMQYECIATLVAMYSTDKRMAFFRSYSQMYSELTPDFGITRLYNIRRLYKNIVILIII